MITRDPRGTRRDDRWVEKVTGWLVYAERKSQAITQTSLALQLGVSVKALEKFERGEAWMRADVYERIRDWVCK